MTSYSRFTNLPPSTLTPPSQNVYQHSPSYPLPRQAPHLEAQNRIEDYRIAAEQASHCAEDIGRKFEALRHFIKDLDNPHITEDKFVTSFCVQFGNPLGITTQRNFLDPLEYPVFREICEEVSQALKGVRNAQEGLRLLQENFRVILGIKNYDGQTLLDQLASRFAFQLDNFRGKRELNTLGETLEKYKNNLQRRIQLPIASGEAIKLCEDAAILSERADYTFKSLPIPAKEAVCKRIWELDGGGRRESDYGEKRVLENKEMLLSHQGHCPLKDALE